MGWLFFIVSMLYTIILIATAGLTLFEVYFNKGASSELIQRQKSHRLFAVRTLFVLVLCSIFEQAIVWLDQFGTDGVQFTSLFFETLTGRVWVASFILVFVGLFVQKASLIYLTVWALLLLFLESIDGHISSLDSYTVLFDFIHLLCAAIWVGGILTFVLNWRLHKPDLLVLMQSYMKVMWLTILAMSISGTLLTIFILPDWLYLLYTPWGQWLIIKIIVVMIALWCGYRVHSYVKKHELPPAKALKIEAIALIATLAIAGAITVLSPQPTDNTLNEHSMGKALHYTVELSPNRPGPNELTVTLWTLEEEGDIASVDVSLIDLEKGERTKETLRLTAVELEKPYDFDGFVEKRFKYNDELRLPYPSEWQQAITITFVSGQVRTITFDFEN